MERENYYYIPGNHKICFIHKIEGEYLILGGLTKFLSDSKTSIVRQKISINNFLKYRPKKIDINNLSEYGFLELTNINAWACREIFQENYFGHYLKLSEKLSDIKNFVTPLYY